ncbi:hypothetical protein MJD09_01520 [bacterium]|nr:hypothetical protein [bacterium]
MLADLQALGLQNGSTYGRIVSGQLPIDSIPDLASLGGMVSINGTMAQTRVGLTTSQGDQL